MTEIDEQRCEWIIMKDNGGFCERCEASTGDINKHLPMELSKMADILKEFADEHSHCEILQ